MTEEVWKSIEGFPDYEVSNLGRVRSLGVKYRPGRIKKLSLSNKGYLRVNLTKVKRTRPTHKTVHRLVSEVFIPNPDNKPYINHINGIKTDNRVENLEWCTAKENTLHAIKTGLKQDMVGENNPQHKLTKEQVEEIRESNLTHYALAEIYGVSKTLIGKVKRRESWTWV